MVSTVCQRIDSLLFSRYGGNVLLMSPGKKGMQETCFEVF